MITKARQLEIAKECGVDLHYINSEISFWTHELDAYTARIEAEVIARMVPVAQEFCKFYGVWMDDKEEDNELEEGTKRILYRLPDSKTESSALHE